MTTGVVKAFHNRNPVLRGELLVNQWGEEYSMVNESFVELQLEVLPSGEYEGELQRNIHSARLKVSIDAARKSLYILHRDLADASRCLAINWTTVTLPTPEGEAPG